MHQRRGLGTLSLYTHKLVAVINLPATRFGDTITLSSQACGCEQLTSGERFGDTITPPSHTCACEQFTSDEVWGHDYVTIASLWLGTTYPRRGLGTRLRYHRKLVAVINLPATRFGDTITIPSRACRGEQLTSDEVWGHGYVTIAKLWL